MEKIFLLQYRRIIGLKIKLNSFCNVYESGAISVCISTVVFEQI